MGNPRHHHADHIRWCEPKTIQHQSRTFFHRRFDAGAYIRRLQPFDGSFSQTLSAINVAQLSIVFKKDVMRWEGAAEAAPHVPVISPSDRARRTGRPSAFRDWLPAPCRG